MAIMMTLSLIVTVINMVILTLLLGISYKNYTKIKAQFNIAIIIFVITFLIQKMYSFYVYFVIMTSYADALGQFTFIIELLQLVAFSVYFWMTNK